MSTVQRYLLKQIAENNISKADGERMLKEINRNKTDNTDEGMAIIGIAGRFANCNNVEEFWSAIKKGENCTGDFPDQRLSDLHDMTENKSYMEFVIGDYFTDMDRKECKRGGYFKEIDKFDAAFFGLSPTEAKYMEPVQRIFLETAYESIEDAGYGGDKIYGTRTGVFVGRDHTDLNLYRYMTQADPMHVTGSYVGILASRVSYIFNLQGPAVVIDTACSSALVTIHEACRSIRDGECDMAIAGGVNIFYSAKFKELDNKVSLSAIESPEETVRTFDKNAEGTIWGEGIGAILLKPLNQALSDGDHIHAVIKGSAINNDGASNGITAPNASAQEEVILAAWKRAGIAPETIGYVEAHGTGTVLGDPIEIKGLTNAFRKFTDKTQFCGIGSLKPNMGHLVAASGIASLMKAVMSLKNKMLPPSIHFDHPNPYINFIQSPVYVNDVLKDWEKEDHPRRAGISSFGFSGTNCHIILEEVEKEANPLAAADAAGPGVVYFLTMSAKSDAVLLSMIQAYRNAKQSIQSQAIESICYTSNTGRGHYTHRLALLVHSVQDLYEKIDSIDVLETKESQGIFYGQHKVILESKGSRAAGDITEAERARNTKKVHGLIVSLSNRRSKAEQEEQIATASEICRLYTAGAGVEWDILYGGTTKKAVLPVYPFARVRYWAESKKTKLLNKINEGSQLHPLIHNLLTDSIEQQIYESYFSTEHWILSDHKIMGYSVIPGTTYMEMAREIAARYYQTNQLELKDITFLAPMTVNEHEKKYVQIILKKEKEYLEFIIASQAAVVRGTEGQWTKHAQGRICRLKDECPTALDVNRMLSQCVQKRIHVDMAKVEDIFHFGPRWYSLKEVNYGANTFTAKVELDQEHRADLDEYYLHPALLDNAMNATMQDNDGRYLPLNYKSFKLFAATPPVFYSYIRKKENLSGSKETIAYDVSLVDPQGRRIAEVTDYTIKKFDAAQLNFNQLPEKENFYHHLAWAEEKSPTAGILPDGTYLIFKDMTGKSDEMIKGLAGQGARYIEVELGNSFQRTDGRTYMIENTQADYDRLLDSVKGEKIRHIIHMCSICNEQLSTLEELEASQNKGAYSLYYLIRAVVNHKLQKELKLTLISNYACEVIAEQDMINPQNATIMGLGKVIGQELETLKVRYLDIDNEVSGEEILNELSVKEASYAAAYRNHRRYTEQLRSIKLSELSTHRTEISNGKTYVITGGTGGLGMEAAAYLSLKGKVNIALINRSKFPERDDWEDILADHKEEKLCNKIKLLKEIERRSTNVSCYRADVSNRQEMQGVLSDIRTKYGRIHGVIHCAGVAGDGFLMWKEEDTLKSVLAPKVRGSRNLDQLTREDNPEFLVMFSSVSAITGAPGQSDYTAANLFMDSYAAYRRRCGLKTISINWPAWKETGMAVDHNAADDVMMCRPISTASALSSLEKVLDWDGSHVIVGDINYQVLSAIKEKNLFGISEQLAAALKQHKNNARKQEKQTNKASVEHSVLLRGKGKEEYTETERLLGSIWGEVLGNSELDIYENFYDMGGDSILATHLLKAIDRVFPEKIDISDIFAYPTIVHMAEYIDKK